MVAMLLLPGVTGQTGSQGGADKGSLSRNLLWSTHLSRGLVQWKQCGGCSSDQPDDVNLDWIPFLLFSAFCVFVSTVPVETFSSQRAYSFSIVKCGHAAVPANVGIQVFSLDQG